VDVLICTPGRLMDHLNGTPNFTLQHLRFLVIDEADRLLAQSFQDWLTQVLAATRPPAHVEAGAISEEASTPYPDALSPAFLHLLRGGAAVHTDLDEKRECSCQKLLFSATLMNDPGRIAALELISPRYVVVHSSSESQESGVLGVVMEKFSIPTTLRVRNVSRLFVSSIKVDKSRNTWSCATPRKSRWCFSIWFTPLGSRMRWCLQSPLNRRCGLSDCLSSSRRLARLAMRAKPNTRSRWWRRPIQAISAHLNASRFWKGLRPRKSTCQVIFLTRFK